MLNIAEIPDTELAEEQRESFKVTDLGGATWAMRKLASLEAQKRTIDQTANYEVGRIENWRTSELDRLGRDAAYFENLLIAYHKDRLAEDPKAKTVRLPHGALKCRAQQPEYTRDDSAVLDWARNVDPAALIEITEALRWADLKKRVRPREDGTALDFETGEIIPGLTVTIREPKHTVEVEVE